ncbi:MAG: hypothetical protein LUF02_08215 [Erysipelotrichaceae bacterium]|nr:hypothetical protein [Erysipelotrichaceae bacterium]
MKIKVLTGFIGTFVGVILWIAMSQLGIFPSWCGFIVVWGCFIGYELIHSGLNKQGVMICMMMSIVMIIIAEMICLGLEIYSYANNYYEVSLLSSFLMIPLFIANTSIMITIILDIIIGLIFEVIGYIAYIKIVKKLPIINKNLDI